MVHVAVDPPPELRRGTSFCRALLRPFCLPVPSRAYAAATRQATYGGLGFAYAVAVMPGLPTQDAGVLVSSVASHFAVK